MYEYSALDDTKMRGTLLDWRKALRTPATYRVGNTVRVQPQLVLLVVLMGVFIILICYYHWWTDQVHQKPVLAINMRPYNKTYPFTTPILRGSIVTFRIALVADLDTESKSKLDPYTFISYLKKGYLSYHRTSGEVFVSWDKSSADQLSSTYSHKGRGMELSELIIYDGRLLTFDDRSGMVFEIKNNKMIPWVVLVDGNGETEKGFKAEWATIKDEVLYVGSMGKEWTTSSGKLINYYPMWVKAINMHGEVQHLNWINNYKVLRSSMGIHWPGYLVHESGAWSDITSKWYFLPRRCSHESYNETLDEVRGCNYLIISDNNFTDAEAKQVAKLKPKHGFSSFKFIPGTNDQALVALKTTEFEGKTATYITAFTTDGQVLLEDTLVEDMKYEGLEFI